jgi:dTMP kinase
MDIGLSRDIFDSFLEYQALVAARFKELQKTFGFTILDGNRSINEITIELRKRINDVLCGKD